MSFNYARKNIHTVDDIRAIADNAGSYFFSPDTMRVFSSRIIMGVFPAMTNAPALDSATPGNVFYFVTSERDTYADTAREYSVRSIELLTDDNGRVSVDIDRVGDTYATKGMARLVAQSRARYHSRCAADGCDRIAVERVYCGASATAPDPLCYRHVPR
jgi:hypothetical protein